MIHLDTNEEGLTLDDIRAVPLLKPKNAGSYWEGISHGELINTLLQCLHDYGYKPFWPVYALSKDKADLAAAFHLSPSPLPAGLTLNIAVQTSNARRRAVSLCVGLQIDAGGNFVSGDIPINRKHTNAFKLYDELMEGVKKFKEAADHLTETVEGYKSHLLSFDDIDLILMRAGRLKPRTAKLPWDKIGWVSETMRTQFPKVSNRTSWRLLQVYSWAAASSPPLRQLDILSKFRELVPLPCETALSVG